MDMKNFAFLAFSLLLCMSCSADKNIDLVFEVSGSVPETLALVCNADIHEIAVDGEGRGECILYGTDAAYAQVFCGDKRKMIYVEAGDKAVLSFSGDDFDGTFRFDGEKAPAVEYLNATELKALPDSCYALGFEEFLELTMDMEDLAAERLESYGLDGIGNFTDMEKGRIRYSYANTLLMYPVAHQFMARNPFYKPDERYYQVIGSYAVETPMFADLREYREFMTESAHALDPENRDEKELYPKLVAEMRYIIENYHEAKTVNALLHHIVLPYIETFGTDGTEEMTDIYKSHVSDPYMMEDFDDACAGWATRTPAWKQLKPGRR